MPCPRRHLLIVARTDAAASEGLDGAVAQTRAELYELIGLADYKALDASLVQSVLPAAGGV